MKTILSIDGGGIKVAGPVRYLCDWHSFGGGYWTKPDLYAGISAGGLAAVAAAVGYSWEEIRIWTQRYNPRIFAKPPFWWRWDLTRPKYRNGALLAMCQALFKDRRCCDVETPWITATYDAETKTADFLTERSPGTLVDAVMRTTAAPTFFEPWERRYLDGVYVCNDPSAIAIAELKSRGVPLDQIRCLSLATSGESHGSMGVGPRTPKLLWAAPTIDALMDGSSDVSQFLARAMIGDRLLRVVPSYPQGIPIDSVGSAPLVEQAWGEQYQATKAQLSRWADL